MGLFTADQVRALLRKHRLPPSQPVQAEFEGVVNEVWFAGEVVVRINKDLEYESDVWTESVAVPALVAHEIFTPRLLIFDSDLDIVPRLVTIYERKLGYSLSRTQHIEDPGMVYRSLGQRVREYHDRVKVVDDPNGKLDPAWIPDYPAARDTLVSIDGSTDAWLPRELVFRSDAPPIFCHQDLHPDNILVDNDQLSAIIDWGDAAWGSRTTDMRYIPSHFVGDFLQGYGNLSNQDRINLLIHHVDQFGYGVKNRRSYGRYGDSDIEGLKSLVQILLK